MAVIDECFRAIFTNLSNLNLVYVITNTKVKFNSTTLLRTTNTYMQHVRKVTTYFRLPESLLTLKPRRIQWLP